MAQETTEKRTYTVDDGVAKVYFGRENLEWIRGECEKRGMLNGGRPNVSGFVQLVLEFWRKHEAKSETLAALAVTAPKDTRERIRAALRLAEGSYTKAAEQLNVPATDFRRAVAALDMGDEIAKRWKGAA